MTEQLPGGENRWKQQAIRSMRKLDTIYARLDIYENDRSHANAMAVIDTVREVSGNAARDTPRGEA